ncbi:MAG: acyl-CoA reductase [Hydrotalea sp.]|nr:acyl-CoA reductase [Hydrotalea sp.]
MTLEQRIDAMVHIGNWMKANTPEWQEAKNRATISNPWFTPEFISLAERNIIEQFLNETKLLDWAESYKIPNEINNAATVGLVLAGNIPMVGFHDFLSVWMSGHNQVLKLSSKDQHLLPAILKELYNWHITTQNRVSIAEQLKGCDAYIATGSNNSGRYFEYYFGKFPNIIRKNKTSVAILSGDESKEELDALSNDICLFYGLGCRNVTKVYAPDNYSWDLLLEALRKYEFFMDDHRYKGNFDYHLTLLLMNQQSYLSNGSIILTENPSLFSPISQIHIGYYSNKTVLISELKENQDVQCVVGRDNIPFGNAQAPTLHDYADGIDTMAFLMRLENEVRLPS